MVAPMVLASPELIVGRIPFLVCAPFFHSTLEGSPFMRFVDGVPRKLNQELHASCIDCAPSSSIEYARHSSDYFLFPGISTSSKMEMRSVLLLSQKPWEELQDEPVQLSSDSDTSNVLFQILSQRFYKVKPLYIDAEKNISLKPEKIIAQVFIGDEALRQSQSGNWPYRYDLGGEWRHWQGLPFAFGLWMVRKAIWPEKKIILSTWRNTLQESLQFFKRDPALALQKWMAKYPSTLTMEFALDFYNSADYTFGLEQEESLQTYFRLAFEEKLLAKIPKLRYLPS